MGQNSKMKQKTKTKYRRTESDVYIENDPEWQDCFGKCAKILSDRIDDEIIKLYLKKHESKNSK